MDTILEVYGADSSPSCKTVPLSTYAAAVCPRSVPQDSSSRLHTGHLAQPSPSPGSSVLVNIADNPQLKIHPKNLSDTRHGLLFKVKP